MRNVLIIAVAATALLAACDRAKSPETVAQDVASAEQKAAAEVAKSEESASKDVGKAADKVGDKLVDLNNTAATDAYNVAVAKADGDRKVAAAKCLALNGNDQKLCKDQADADYAAAKAAAKADSVAQKQ